MKGMVINYMILLNSKAIMPLQPYIVLMSDNYKSIEFSQFGISHFYEFNVIGSIPALIKNSS